MCDVCDQVKAITQEWADKQGHERCHYYPELFRRLAEVLGVKSQFDPCLPLRPEFEKGCRRYQDEEYGTPWRNSDSLEQRIEMLEAELKAAHQCIYELCPTHYIFTLHNKNGCIVRPVGSRVDNEQGNVLQALQVRKEENGL